MSTPRTDNAAKSGDWPMETLMESRRLETELAAVTKKLELCMAANSDVRRIALERNSFESQLAAERAKVAKLRDALEMAITQFSSNAISKSLAETAPKEEAK